MKVWKLALAILLACGVVAAYRYFPNPLDAAEAPAKTAPDAADGPV